MSIREELIQRIKQNPEELAKIAREDPALLDYLLADANLKQKWCKLRPDMENGLRQVSQQTGLAEGILIGLGIALLIWLLSEGRR